MTFRGTTLVLTLSLAANAALLAVIEIRDPGLLHFDTFGKPAAAPPIAATQAATMAGSRAAVGPGLADQLLKGDPRTVIGRLRAAGFSRAVIRAVAREMINAQLHDREKAIADRIALKPYWKARFNDFDQGAMSDMHAFSREKNKMIEDLLGDEPSDATPIAAVFIQGARGGLSPEAYRRVDAIQSDYADMKQKVLAAANGVIMPEDQEKLAFLDKQQAADLAEVLSPEDLFDYQLHTSPTASTLRNSLTAFDPSEDEFKAIFKAQQDFNAQYGSPDGPLTADQQQQRQAHQADLLASIQQVLSPDRFADYKTDTDPAYVNVDRLVQQLNLPPDTTQQVVALQSDYSQQAAAINGNSQISPADKITQLGALGDDATAKLTAALGPRGFFAYQQANGSWLQQLKPKGK
jgi:hypothetical protein